MKGEDLDFVLARNDGIVPSQGFTASVMEAITREATEPQPIPFPWKRALPGLVWCVVAGIAFFVAGRGTTEQAPAAPGSPDLSAVLTGAVWISAALVVSLLSVALSRQALRRV